MICKICVNVTYWLSSNLILLGNRHQAHPII